MNAIVALCHFCEAHGPRAFFCTHTDFGDIASSAVPAQPCAACGSLGVDTVLTSRSEDGVAYYSRESLPSAELTTLLRQAAVRSLTCEVSWSADGGCVYLSEGPCHVLSTSFQLSDSRARGLRRWFSCVVLMRDSAHLLSLMPFFSQHMQKTASDLKSLTSEVFEEEQKICSQRALRLNTGKNDFGPSRSLQQLTGDDDIFHKLHLSFTWMLECGARTYSETLHTSGELLASLDPGGLRGSAFAPGVCQVRPGPGVRSARDRLGRDVFRVTLYCVLTGIELVIKSDKEEDAELVQSLSKLLPVSSADAFVPNLRFSDRHCETHASAGVCVVHCGNSKFECLWPGKLPQKCPTLMTKIENCVNNSIFTDSTLDQHIKSLQLEWLGIAKTLKNAHNSSGTSSALLALERALGIGSHDQQLVNYWIKTFCV